MMKSSGALKALIVLFIAGILPLIIKQDYYIHLLILVLMWVIIGSCWNLIAGYTGQVSFGQAAFFGIGAYTAGIFYTKLEISPWWGMAFGGWSAVILGLDHRLSLLSSQRALFCPGHPGLRRNSRGLSPITGWTLPRAWSGS